MTGSEKLIEEVVEVSQSLEALVGATSALKGRVGSIMEALKQEEHKLVDLQPFIVQQITDNVLAALNQKVVVASPATKRHWEDAQKRHIVMEAARAKSSGRGLVSKVCEKYGITTAHLTQWKKQLHIK